MDVDDEDLLRFEAGAHENGVAWWSARWLMELLGYSTWTSFKNVLTHVLTPVKKRRNPPRRIAGQRARDLADQRAPTHLVVSVRPVVRRRLVRSSASLALNDDPSILTISAR